MHLIPDHDTLPRGFDVDTDQVRLVAKELYVAPLTDMESGMGNEENVCGCEPGNLYRYLAD